MNLQFATTPSESKRLISKAVIEILKDRIETGMKILVTRGSTNSYVIDELYTYLGADRPEPQKNYIIGQILEGADGLSANSRDTMAPEILIDNMEIKELKTRQESLDAVRSMGLGDAVLKGANALDYNGVAGVLLGNQEWGGTIGTIYPVIKARGIDLFIPVGLEKLISADVGMVSEIAGAAHCTFSRGMPCGLFPVSGIVITELDALQVLFDVEVLHIASGGLMDAQGSVVLLVETNDLDELNRCKAFLEKHVFGEPPLVPNYG
ncbi:MAG: hypothetical protein ACTSUE_25655 [Promethearchaeota archaeon]